MDFFDKLGKKISEGYNAAAEKTKEVANETKLKFAISDCKDKIGKEYTQIGEKIYGIFLNDRDNEIALKLINEFKEIDALNEKIKGYENEMLETNKKTKCSNCGEEINIDAAYCPKCGNTNKKEEPHVFEGEIVKDDSNK